MEGMTAKWYASLTHKSMEDFKADARRVAAQLPEGARVLEVAPGPGYFAIELAKLGRYRVKGLDISHTFVEIAGRNASEAGVAIDFQQGNAAEMPFRDRSFDFVFCRAAFKNFAEPIRALSEMHRVLAKGGRALISDLRRDASQESVNKAVDDMHVGAINGVITKLTFRFMLFKRAYTKSEFERMLAETPFGSGEIAEGLISLEASMCRAD